MTAELVRNPVETPYGSLPVWRLRGGVEPARPVLAVLLGVRGDAAAASALWAPLLADFEPAVIELPLQAGDALAEPTLERVADAVGHGLHTSFAGREVALLGVEDGGLPIPLLSLPEARAAITIAAPLTGVDEAEGADLRARLHGADARRYADLVLGVGAEAVAPRDYRSLFDAASAAVRQLARADLPMLADELRALWARRPPGATDAARAAALGRAAPLEARAWRYVGPSEAAFASAFQARCPDAQAGTDDYELLVLDGPLPDEPTLAALVAGLGPGGVVIASPPLGAAADQLRRALWTQDLRLSPPERRLAPAGGTLLRATRRGGPPLRLDLVTYAPRLMDIRTRLPAEALRSDPALRVNVMRPPFRLDRDPQGRGRIAVLQRPAAWTARDWRQTAKRAIAAGIVLVMEFDDHPELVSQMTLGGGLTPEGWARFRFVHAVQTSTEPLVRVFRTHNPEVRAFPNAVFELGPAPPAAPPRRVFYGAVTRGPVAVDVAQALGPAVAAFPDTEFLVVGDRAVFDALPTARKRFFDYLPYERYLAVLAGCGVSLSPLAQAPMVDTKSDAKFLDAARAGVVTIASPTVYAETITPGVNGLIAAQLPDWSAQLIALFADPQRHARIGLAAWETVRGGRMFAHQAADRRDWYLDLLARRDALNRALEARLAEG